LTGLYLSAPMFLALLILSRLKKTKKFVISIKKKLLWSPVLRGQIQTYFQSCLMVMAVIDKNDNKSQIFVLKLLIVLLLPLFSYVKLRVNMKLLENPKFKQRYGTLYQNLNVLKHPVYEFISLFCLKRVLIAVGTKILISPICINIGLYLYISLFYIGYNFRYKPMSTKIIQFMDNINETFILMSGYAITLFSNWIYDFKWR
jgi:hypothetical protein